MFNSAGRAWNSGNKREAIRRLTKVLKMDPSYYLAWVERAEAYFELKSYKRAMRDLQQAEKSDTSERALTFVKAWRAYIYMRQGKFANASELLDDAIRVFPDIPSYRFALGVIAQKQNNLARALNYYESTLAELDKNPTEQKELRAPVLFNKSICLRRDDRADDATTVLNLAAAISPALAQRKHMCEAPVEPIYMVDFTGFVERFGFPEHNEVYRTVY